MPLPTTPERGRLDGPFRILVVCTGNVCRSPLMAAVLRAELAKGEAPILVTSAGVQAPVGASVDPAVVDAARLLSIDVTPHRARALQTVEEEEADLILVATTQHRAVVVERTPAVVSRAFTYLELDSTLARLGAADVVLQDGSGPRVRLTRVVRAAARARGQASRDIAIDVPDPYGGSIELHRSVADTIAAAAIGIAARLLELAAVPRVAGGTA